MKSGNGPRRKPNENGSANRLRKLLGDCGCTAKDFFRVAEAINGAPENFSLKDEIGRFDLVVIRGIVSSDNFKMPEHVLQLAESLFKIADEERSTHFRQLLAKAR